jgi:ubiquinone/menaquinone biosynthesis C-methylase UbiE
MGEKHETHRGAADRVYSEYARSRRKQRAWAADNPGNLAIRAELLSYLLGLARLQLQGGGEILDVGCGTGWCLRALADDGVDPGRLHGIEIQRARADAARLAVPGAAIEIGNALRLDFQDGSFALVLLLALLSSLDSADAVRGALAEARRVVAPGGLILCYEPRVPNPLNPRTRLLRNSDLNAAGLTPREQLSLTLLPALARRLGSRTPARYQRLARVPVLRTHRLVAYTSPAE